MYGRGRAALEQLCRWLQQGNAADAPASVAALPLEARLQFVQRCHLAMHRPDEAGDLAHLQSATHCPVIVTQLHVHIPKLIM